jgi:ABC-type transport system involved in multi-copper enzyme maturation permease subunit
MITTFKAEWRKLSRRPAVWWLAAFIVAMVAVVYGFTWIEYNSSSFRPDTHLTLAQLKATLYPANFASLIVSGLPVVGGALMLVMGALAVGSEYGWTTFKTTYTQRPGRLQVLAGQLAAISAINAVVVVALYVVAASSSFVIVNVAGAPVVWPAFADILKAAAASWLIFEVWILFGMMMAYLFRQSALAIGLGVAYMLAIEGIVFRALRGLNLDWLTTVEKFMVGQNANSLANSFPSASVPSIQTLVSIEHAVLVVVGYAIAFVVLSATLVRVRDVP